MIWKWLFVTEFYYRFLAILLRMLNHFAKYKLSRLLSLAVQTSKLCGDLTKGYSKMPGALLCTSQLARPCQFTLVFKGWGQFARTLFHHQPPQRRPKNKSTFAGPAEGGGGGGGGSASPHFYENYKELLRKRCFQPPSPPPNFQSSSAVRLVIRSQPQKSCVAVVISITCLSQSVPVMSRLRIGLVSHDRACGRHERPS